MPNPRGAPPRERPAPENLDALVREALRGGGSVAAIRAVLERRTEDSPRVPDPNESPLDRGGAGPAAPASPGSPPPRPSARGVPVPEATDPRLERGSPPAPMRGSPDPVAPWRLLADLAVRARSVAETRGPAAAADLVDDLRRALQAAEAASRAPGDAEEAEALEAAAVEALDADPDEDAADAATLVAGEGSEVELPPYRHPFVLLLDPQVPDGREERLGEALEVDPATVRGLLRARWPVVALRGSDRSMLERRAARVRLLAGYPAAVFDRAELYAEPPAWTLLGRDTEGRWRVSREALWRDEPDPRERPPGEPWEPGPVRALVPGEVTVRTRRGGAASSRWTRDRYTPDGASHERRVPVLDVHTDEAVVRITAAVTDFRGLPGHDPASAERSMRALLERLAEVFPGPAPLGRRAVGAPAEPGGGARVESGWPWWEEHSRWARVWARASAR